MLYNFVSLTISDVYLQINTQSFSVTESTTITQVPDLSCTSSGSISIVYSLDSYNSAIVPSFVSINSTTGVLSISAPSVSSSTNYSFYITSTISVISNPVQKIINLTVNKCTVGNCQICTITDSSICTTCNPGYSLSLGSWNLPYIPPTQPIQQATSISETAKLLSTINQAVTGLIILMSIGLSLANLTSMASLWSVINQTQIFRYWVLKS